MQVFKWGDSLAVCLPAAVVEALELEEGDHIEVSVAGRPELVISRDSGRDAALERLRKLQRRLPSGFTFDRVKANER